MYTRHQFTELFNAALDAVRNAESVTKRELKGMSRDLLAVLHAKGGEMEGDVQFINALLGVVTPMNRRTLVLYFQAFTGFHHDGDTGLFTKKDKKAYEEKRDAALKFLDDPHNNVWTWAERNVEVEVKPFDVNKVTTFIANALKKTKGDQLAVLRAVFAGGITPVAIHLMMEEMALVEEARAKVQAEAKAEGQGAEQPKA